MRLQQASVASEVRAAPRQTGNESRSRWDLCLTHRNFPPTELYRLVPAPSIGYIFSHIRHRNAVSVATLFSSVSKVSPEALI